MFMCKRCGECCKATPHLTKKDIKRIKKLGLKEKDFVESINDEDYLKYIDGQCLFLKDQDNGLYYCSIHPYRPETCRLYPNTQVKDCRPEKTFFDQYLKEKKWKK